MPKISILTNNYNGSNYINDYFKSIYSQTFIDWELIFFDNKSTDNSLELLNKYLKKDNRIKLFINDKNSGLGYARSKALKLCSAEYIAVWDIDDTAHMSRLKTQLEFLIKNKDVALVASNVLKLSFSQITKYKIKSSPEFIKSQLIWRNILVHSSVMYKKKAALLVGGYDQNYNYSQDYNFYLKLLKNNFKISSIDEYLCNQTINRNGLSLKKSMKKIIIKDQINNLIEARKINNIKINHKILNTMSKVYYNLKLLFV
tara:strand:+ start:21124 stop:21897 length:774 start_codon:yes stop_codon:yes gene_type:complete